MWDVTLKTKNLHYNLISFSGTYFWFLKHNFAFINIVEVHQPLKNQPLKIETTCENQK